METGPKSEKWHSPNDDIAHSESWLNPPQGTSGTEQGFVFGGDVYPNAEAAMRYLGPLIGKNLEGIRDN